MDRKKLFKEYHSWDSVVLIAAILGTVVKLIKAGQIKILKQIVVKMVTEAEKGYGAGTGDIKLADVVSRLYEYLPDFAKVLFTRKQLVNITESVLTETKKKRETNASLTEYIKKRDRND